MCVCVGVRVHNWLALDFVPVVIQLFAIITEHYNPSPRTALPFSSHCCTLILRSDFQTRSLSFSLSLSLSIFDFALSFWPLGQKFLLLEQQFSTRCARRSGEAKNEAIAAHGVRFECRTFALVFGPFAPRKSHYSTEETVQPDIFAERKTRVAPSEFLLSSVA